MRKPKKLVSMLLAAALSASACMPFTSHAAVSDPDGNGTIELNDAVIIMMYLAGLNEPTNLEALDFDCNGIISDMDSQSVQLYIAHLWRG